MQYRRIVLALTAASVAEIFNKLIPFVMLHLAMRRLGVEGFGQGQYVFWLVDLMNLLIIFGYHQYGAIGVGQQLDHSDRERVMSAMIIGKAVNATLVLIGIWCWLSFHLETQLGPVAWSAVTIAIFFTTLDMTFGQLATAQLSSFSAANILGKIVGLISVYLLVEGPADGELYALCLVLSNATISSISIWVMLRRFRLRLVSISDLTTQLQRALAFAPAIVLMVTIDRFDLYFVERWFGMAATGQYAGSSRIVQAVLPLVSMVGNVFLAEMLQLKEAETVEQHFKVSLTISAAVVMPVVVALLLFAGPIIELVYGMNRTEMVVILQVLAISLMGQALYFSFGVQFLPLKGRIQHINLGLAWCTVLGLGSCYLLADQSSPLVIAIISSGVKCMLGLWCVLLARSFLNFSVAGLIFRASIPALVAGAFAVFFSHWLIQLMTYLIIGGGLSAMLHRHAIATLLTRARRKLITG